MLDAHLSGRAVGKALVESGHDVRALDSESVLEGMEDPAVLELAFAESRVLVTANVSDFEPLLRSGPKRGDPTRAWFLCLRAFPTKGSACSSVEYERRSKTSLKRIGRTA